MQTGIDKWKSASLFITKESLNQEGKKTQIRVPSQAHQESETPAGQLGVSVVAAGTCDEIPVSFLR